ncbi:MAG: TIGR03960 family B12-binding radical SAM protein [Anaerolineales bacterium]|nr:TIGR03960 family B12-binding radical SAM protein [Anaerolineales bacterium]
MKSSEVERALDRLLPGVQKPGRYTGGELNQVVKDWSTTPVRVALAFPDIYDLGMSNLGLAILYDILNRQPDVLAERVYAPWTDMEKAMREASIPLHSLETKHPLNEFDILGFSLPYETLYTNTINMLDLAGIPLRTDERRYDDPLVIAGGHATHNPEPMAEFIDAFVIGEGEDVILEIVRCYQTWKSSGKPRLELHRELAKIWGVYVPSLYQVHYLDDGTISHVEPLAEEARLPLLKRIVPRLPPPITNFIVPFIDVTHNRIPIEIMRGCTRGCRFCQAGMITRPVRERSVHEILDAIETSIAQTGYEEVGLLSLSSSDYDDILELVRAVRERFGDDHLNISLPSLRIETFSVELMELLMGTSSRRGFTLAPEAASERMREIINKPVQTEQLLETARQIYQRGWHTIKLYFMIGHPSETLDDVQAIADLCKAVLKQGRAIIGKRAKVHAGVSTFVPKPHTPFQWAPCETQEQIEAKQALLRRQLRGPGLKLNWNQPEETLLEAWLSRGDRRLGEVILRAWRNGAKFDAWQESFKYEAWMQAFEDADIDPMFYTHRERPIDETLPWDHIDAGVKKQFLTEDYLWSLQGRTRVDCRERCFACGILPKFADLRRANPGQAWECPEVRSPSRKSLREVVPVTSL